MLRNPLITENQKLKEDLREISEKKDILDNKAKELKGRLEHMTNEARKLSDNFDKKKEQNRVLQERNTDLEQNDKKLKEKIRKATEKIAGLLREKEVLSKGNEELSNKFEKLIKKYNTQGDQNQVLKETNKILRNQNASLEKENKELKEINDNLNIQVNEYKELNQKHRRLRAENGVNRRWKKVYKERIGELILEKRKLEKSKAELQNHLDLAQDEIKELEDYVATTQEKKNSIISQQRNKMIELRAESKKQNKKINELEKEKKDLSEIIEEYAEDISDLEDLKNDKNLKIVRLTSEKEALKKWKDNHRCSPPVNNCCHFDYNFLKNTIATAEKYLGVKNLATLTIDYPLPVGKNLKDLIDFYNNPPLCRNPQHANYKELAAQSNQFLPAGEIQPISPSVNIPTEPVIKEIIQQVDNPSQTNEIKKLKQIISELEEKLSKKQKPVVVQNLKTVQKQAIIIYLLIGITVVLLVSVAGSALINSKKKKKKKQVYYWKRAKAGSLSPKITQIFKYNFREEPFFK